MVWGKELTGNFGRRIKTYKLELKHPRHRRDLQSQKEYNEVQKKLSLIYNQREIFWRQRSKQLWLHSGDYNSKFFHASASIRRRNNHIQRLKMEEGIWVEWDNGLAELMTGYFTDLFTAGQANWEKVVQYIPRSISQTQNEKLMQSITEEEVKHALFQMNPDKSPEPDGMTPGFFQKHWRIVGKDVVRMVEKFFNDGIIPFGLNVTNLVLIPKK